LKHDIFVVKLTGNLFNLPINLKKLATIINVMKSYIDKGRAKFIVVTGGGGNARAIISALREIGVNEYQLDQVGIEITRMHAKILISLLQDEYVCKKIPYTIDEVMDYINIYSLIAMGGISPGMSTNAVSALAAEATKADKLITMTKAGGIYDKDPEKFPNATFLKEVNIDRLFEILTEHEAAGYYPLLDKVALSIIRRSKIDTYVIAPEAEQLKLVLEGKNVGSRIIFK